MDNSNRITPYHEQAEEEIKKLNLPRNNPSELEIYNLKVHERELEIEHDAMLADQERLRIQRREFKSLFHEAPVAYILLNDQGLIIEANCQAADLLETDPTKLPSKPMKQFILGESRTKFDQHFLQVIEFGAGKLREMGMRSALGQNFWVQCHSTRFLQNSGQSHIFLCLIDITDQKQIEDDLIIAKEEAQKIKHLRGNFITNMSHEIKTPLVGIIEMIKLASKTESSEEKQAIMNTIEASAQSLSDIVEDIIDFNLIDDDKVQIINRPFSLRVLGQSLFHMFNLRASEKGLTFNLDVRIQDNRMVLGDQNRVRQILVNLLTNAIDYTHQGHVNLIISEKVVHEFLSEIKFEVRDTGPGIPLSLRNSIWSGYTEEQMADPFMSDETSQKTSGLGLPISKRLAKLMGGQLYFESTEQMGTSFYLSIPLHRYEKMEIAEPVVPSSKRSSGTDIVEKETPEEKGTYDVNIPLAAMPALPEDSSKDLKALIADDDLVSAGALEAMLEQIGLRSHSVENGLLGLDYLDENRVDIVFIDITMPVLDGIETSKRIRNGFVGEENRTIPIVALSAHLAEKETQRFKDAGIELVLKKPVDLATLEELIYEVFYQSSK